MTSTFQLSTTKLEQLIQQVTKSKIDYCKITIGDELLFNHTRISSSSSVMAGVKLHKINSITKSVLSLLIGIALDQQLLESVDTPLSKFFPSLMEASGSTFTIKHLLTMTPGWDWPEMGDWGGLPMPMIDSPNWVSFILNRTMQHKQGTRMIYNSGCSHLLSAIIEQVTGMKTDEYAEKVLFKPLGIDHYRWKSDPNGIIIGGFGLELMASDLHKLGELMLGKGRMGNELIVSPDWIEDSVKPRYLTYDHIGSYGYHWWILNDGDDPLADPYTYFAMGYGGQYIFVVPQYELIATFASSLYKQTFLPYKIFRNFLL